MNSARRRRPTDDTGASLLIVLAFVTFVGMISGAVLSYSGVSLSGTGDTKYRTDVSYDADGALKTAVNQIRNSTYDNDGETDPCDLNGSGTGATLTYPGSNTGESLRVTCTGGLGTGVDGGLVPVTAANKPGSALLVLGTSPAERSLDMQGSNNALRIKGKVFLNSGASVSPGSIEVTNAQFVARGSCTGTITSTPAAECNSGAPAAADPAVASPGAYALPTTGLAYRAVPACAGAGRTTEFLPGYYDDAAALSALFSGSCNSRAYLFRSQPGGGRGVYYFDFRNGDGGGLSGTSHVWSISDKDARVVAGTPSGWTAANPPAAGPAIPGACVSPLNATTSDGVAFVFGGDSRLSITQGQMEICGQYDSGRPPFSIYGATANVGSPSPVDATATGATSPAPVNSGATEFAPAAKIVQTDGEPAVAKLGTGGLKDATIRISGISPAPAIPAGSILTSAELEVIHKSVRTGGNKLASLTATITPNSATPLPAVDVPPAYGPSTMAYTPDRIPVLTTALASEVHAHGLTAATIDYAATVTGTNVVDETVDSVKLVLTFLPPALRAQSGCVITVNGCPLITTSGPSTYAYFQGTTYAPRASIDLTLNNVAGQVFRSGLIVRALTMKITASFSSTAPVIELPDDSMGPGPTDVYFRAYACPDGLTCAGDPAVAVGNWRLVGTAKVSYDDGANTGSPNPGSREVTVRSWTLRR